MAARSCRYIFLEKLFARMTIFKNISPLSGLVRKGMSHDSIPGVIRSNGQTWTEMRRYSLHTLKDLGYGKSILEDVVEEEIDNLLEHIDKNYLNQPITVIRSLVIQK